MRAFVSVCVCVSGRGLCWEQGRRSKHCEPESCRCLLQLQSSTELKGSKPRVSCNSLHSVWCPDFHWKRQHLVWQQPLDSEATHQLHLCLLLASLKSGKGQSGRNRAGKTAIKKSMFTFMFLVLLPHVLLSSTSKYQTLVTWQTQYSLC